MTTNDWFVYILECADGSYYTGVTTDLRRRLKEHNEGKQAASYTRARRPLTLIYQEQCASRSEALKRECAIKALKRCEKEQLVHNRQ